MAASGPTAPNDSGDDATPPEVRTRIVIALGTAFAALLALVVILIAFGRQTVALRVELADLVEPGNAALLDLQRVLAMQMAAQRGYRLGGAEESLVTYTDLLEEEREIHDRLVPLAHAVGPQATAALAGLRGATARWHEVVERAGPPSPEGSLTPRLSTREGYFAQALREADRLGALIDASAERRRRTLMRRQRVEDALIVGMVIVAAIGVIMLAGVGRRLQAVSLEAHRMAALAEARHDELRDATQEKESFIRGITHDLKNPLGVIEGSAELLEIGARGELTPAQRDMTERIRRGAKEMLGIVDDLLALSRAEAAALQVHVEQVDVNELVGEVVEDYRAALEARRHEVRVIPSPHPGAIATDPNRVREIVGNLLTNAAKHTPPGGSVTVRVDGLNRNGGSGRGVAIEVADTGTGVPAGQRESIFREFNRGPDSQGSGIGLAIGRRMARALGGDLELSESAGPGATFRLTLPASTATPLPDPRTRGTGSR